MQGVHAPDPDPGALVPQGQMEQIPEPSTAKAPGAHKAGSLAPSHANPAGQVWHAARPVVLAYVPEAHVVHVPWPTAAAEWTGQDTGLDGSTQEAPAGQ